ncbi:MAG: FAD-dependent oxidoreductase [Cocleimonas sp.]|nr:FAD-dependent oxidoreductase [Cocleimonas sp.]
MRNKVSGLSRRHFLKMMGLGVGIAAAPILTKATQSRPHIIVVGGGFGGATAAKYLRHWSKDVDVTLIEANASYQSPILSNLILNGQRSLEQLNFSYDKLAKNYGVKIIQAKVKSIHSGKKQVELEEGKKLSYDRLILSPGIQFMDIKGLDQKKNLHAWMPNSEILQLKQQIASIKKEGVFLISIPKKPYRCPPGPYERACVVADYFKRKKVGGKVIVLDANAKVTVNADNFMRAFYETYKDIVEYVPQSLVEEVDSDKGVVITEVENYHADVLNIIPPHQASALIHDNGLANDKTERWAAVDPLSYESTQTPYIHIIGDSQGTGQPKAGHIANAEAKICADAVLRLLSGYSPYDFPRTNSACYTPITKNTATWITSTYAYDVSSKKMKLIKGSNGTSKAPTEENYHRMYDWANSLFGDTFS